MIKMKYFSILVACVLIAGQAYAEDEPHKQAVATVNGVEITRGDLSSELNRIIPMTFYHRKMPQEKREAFEKEALDKLINKELKYQYALQQGLTVDNNEVEKELKEVIAKYPNKKAFKEALKKGNFTKDDLRGEIRRRKLIELAYQTKITDQVKISEEEAREYYEKNKEKFVRPLQVHLRNILFKVPALANDFERKAIEDKAKAVMKKIKEGLPFEEAVQLYSEGPEKDKGGDMGMFHKGRLGSDVEETILALQPGEIAGPFKSYRGFYVFKLEEILPEKQIPFEEIKEKLMVDLEEKTREDKGKVWMEELRSQAEITIMVPSDESHAPEEEKALP
jgi:parvulin-like peptidyl-prolyl isomerase